MKYTANLRKMATSFRRKKHQDEKGLRGLRFFMNPFSNVHKASGNTIDPQKPFYVSPDGREKRHQ